MSNTSNNNKPENSSHIPNSANALAIRGSSSASSSSKKEAEIQSCKKRQERPRINPFSTDPQHLDEKKVKIKRLRYAAETASPTSNPVTHLQHIRRLRLPQNTVTTTSASTTSKTDRSRHDDDNDDEDDQEVEEVKDLTASPQEIDNTTSNNHHLSSATTDHITYNNSNLDTGTNTVQASTTIYNTTTTTTTASTRPPRSSSRGRISTKLPQDGEIGSGEKTDIFVSGEQQHRHVGNNSDPTFNHDDDGDKHQQLQQQHDQFFSSGTAPNNDDDDDDDDEGDATTSQTPEKNDSLPQKILPDENFYFSRTQYLTAFVSPVAPNPGAHLVQTSSMIISDIKKKLLRLRSEEPMFVTNNNNHQDQSIRKKQHQQQQQSRDDNINNNQASKMNNGNNQNNNDNIHIHINNVSIDSHKRRSRRVALAVVKRNSAMKKQINTGDGTASDLTLGMVQTKSNISKNENDERSRTGSATSSAKGTRQNTDKEQEEEDFEEEEEDDDDDNHHGNNAFVGERVLVQNAHNAKHGNAARHDKIKIINPDTKANSRSASTSGFSSNSHGSVIGHDDIITYRKRRHDSNGNVSPVARIVSSLYHQNTVNNSTNSNLTTNNNHAKEFSPRIDGDVPPPTLTVSSAPRDADQVQSKQKRNLTLNASVNNSNNNTNLSNTGWNVMNGEIQGNRPSQNQNHYFSTNSSINNNCVSVLVAGVQTTRNQMSARNNDQKDDRTTLRNDNDNDNNSPETIANGDSATTTLVNDKMKFSSTLDPPNNNKVTQILSFPLFTSPATTARNTTINNNNNIIKIQPAMEENNINNQDKSCSERRQQQDSNKNPSFLTVVSRDDNHIRSESISRHQNGVESASRLKRRFSSLILGVASIPAAAVTTMMEAPTTTSPSDERQQQKDQEQAIAKEMRTAVFSYLVSPSCSVFGNEHPKFSGENNHDAENKNHSSAQQGILHKIVPIVSEKMHMKNREILAMLQQQPEMSSTRSKSYPPLHPSRPVESHNNSDNKSTTQTNLKIQKKNGQILLLSIPGLPLQLIRSGYDTPKNNNNNNNINKGEIQTAIANSENPYESREGNNNNNNNVVTSNNNNSNAEMLLITQDNSNNQVSDNASMQVRQESQLRHALTFPFRLLVSSTSTATTTTPATVVGGPSFSQPQRHRRLSFQDHQKSQLPQHLAQSLLAQNPSSVSPPLLPFLAQLQHQKQFEHEKINNNGDNNSTAPSQVQRLERLQKASNATTLADIHNAPVLHEIAAIGSETILESFLAASPSIFDGNWRCARYPGRFRPLVKLGQGAFGTAFLVSYNEDETKVAKQKEALNDQKKEMEETKVVSMANGTAVSAMLNSKKNDKLAQHETKNSTTRNGDSSSHALLSDAGAAVGQLCYSVSESHRSKGSHIQNNFNGTFFNSIPPHTTHPLEKNSPRQDQNPSRDDNTNLNKKSSDNENNNDDDGDDAFCAPIFQLVQKPSPLPPSSHRHIPVTGPCGGQSSMSCTTPFVKVAFGVDRPGSRTDLIPRDLIFVCKVETLLDDATIERRRKRKADSERQPWDKEEDEETARHAEMEANETQAVNGGDGCDNVSPKVVENNNFNNNNNNNNNNGARKRRLLVDDLSKKRIQRMQHEAHILSNLAHPNIVGFIDFEHDKKGNQHLLFIEYVDGGDLRGELTKRIAPTTTANNNKTSGAHQQQQQQQPAAPRYLTEDVVLHLFVQVVLAMEYLHRHNILHRDIKSHNILLSKNFFVKLTDFGTARQFDEDVADDVEAGSIGTPLYMDPNLLVGQSYSEKAEMWALGVLLYEIITLGNFPFLAKDKPELALVVRSTEPRPLPRDRDQDISVDVRAMLAALLQKDPARRPTAKQLFTKFPCMRKALDRYIQAAELQSKLSEFCSVTPQQHAAAVVNVISAGYGGVQAHIASIQQQMKQKRQNSSHVNTSSNNNNNSSVGMHDQVKDKKNNNNNPCANQPLHHFLSPHERLDFVFRNYSNANCPIQQKIISNFVVQLSKKDSVVIESGTFLVSAKTASVDAMWCDVLKDHRQIIFLDSKSSQKSKIATSIARGEESRIRSFRINNSNNNNIVNGTNNNNNNNSMLNELTNTNLVNAARLSIYNSANLPVINVHRQTPTALLSPSHRQQ